MLDFSKIVPAIGEIMRSAVIASIGRATGHAVMLTLNSALLTDARHRREPLFFEMLKAAFIVGELALKSLIVYRKCFGIVCLRFMHKQSSPVPLLDVKG